MPTRIHHRLVAGAIATGLVASALVTSGGVASAANPQKFLSHFLCWAGTFPAFDGPVVQLTNRFGTFDADVAGADLMCNPVRKKRGTKVTEIVSDRQHLKHYDIDTDPIPGTYDMLVTNQFGRDKRVIISKDPGGLLVPTRKFPHKAPRGLDHFTCYGVTNNFDVNKRAKLRDQFAGFKTTVVEELFHCFPTKKVHGARTFEIRHPKASLACYNINPRVLDQPKSRRTKNQFEDAQITAAQALFLCVPSKTRPTPLP
jgi:hypothetical protein